jgi:TP901 family phage tail tape measure protein
MAMDRDVTIDFNADISGYSASMTQMIAQSQQYSAAADNMIGKVGKLNSVVLAGVKAASAFTQSNKTATAQAAAYQQQLSKIETTAKITNKNFGELEKTTKGLAKEFPIGMGKAVEQVESLQEVGITTNKEIKSLAKTFTQLGAATGTYGAQIGKDMVQLSRTFGNSTDSMQSFADSLTSVTAKYGANAGATVNFAKSIAPIASTVGMTETQVIGLSTAFSRLDEDGYAAANTFNKVMLDMNKSIREGTPEAKVYAEVMGTTSESLKQTWESNPAEGFIQFVEAIKAQGSDGVRSLEQLGFEGIRTQKSLTALSQSGNIRGIVEEAQKSYGGGATATGAEEAFSGVNDQLTMLQEKMSQTTAAAGKPFLGMLEKILQVANAVSGAIDKLAGSLSGVMKIVGTAGAAAVAVRTFGAWTGMAAFGENAVRGALGSNMARGFTAGRRDPMEFMTRPGATRAQMFGARVGDFFGAGSGEGRMAGPMRGIRGLTNMGGNLAGLYYRSNASQIARALGEAPLSTEAGRRAQGIASNMAAIAGDKAIPASVRAQIGKDLGRDLGGAIKDMAKQPGGLGRGLGAFGDQTALAGRYWMRTGAAAGGAIGRGIGGLASGAAGLVGLGGLGLPALAALGGVAAAGVGVMKWRQGEKGAEEAVTRGSGDAYRLFNEFAEKAGIASKGLVTFSEALSESTNKITSRSTSMEEALKVTPLEQLQANSPGYEEAYKTRRNAGVKEFFTNADEDPRKEAIRLRGVLGANPTTQAINQVQIDLVKQLGAETTDKVMEQYKQVSAMSSKDIEQLLKDEAGKAGQGPINTKEQNEFLELASAEAARRQKANEDIFGQTATTVKTMSEAAKTWDSVTQKLQSGQADAYSKETTEGIRSSGKALGLTDDEIDRLQQTVAQGSRTGSEPMTMVQALKGAGLDKVASNVEKQDAALREQNMSLSGLTESQLGGMSVSQREKDAVTSAKSMMAVGGNAGTVAVELANLSGVVRKSGTASIEEFSEAGMKGATAMQKAFAEVKMDPGDFDKTRKLAGLVAESAMQAGKTGQERQQIIQTAMTSTTGEEIPALQLAQKRVQQQTAVEEVGKSPLKQMADAIQAGKQAERLLQTTPNATQAVKDQWESTVDAGMSAADQMGETLFNFNKQQTRAQEDYHRNIDRMNRNFAQSQQYASEDFYKSQRYAAQDFHRSMKYARQDYHRAVARAERDFNKQMKRQSEQTAKDMYDPYQRIPATQVTDTGLLQGNLQEQNKAIKDQLSSVKKLSKMGLSKDAIDQLDLLNPEKGNQVQRMLSDAMANPGQLKQVNASIKERLKMGAELATSEYNRAYVNMKSDFDQNMKDQEKDYTRAMSRQEKAFKTSMGRSASAFATSQSRAATQHATALSDMKKDNDTAITRAYEDLAGLAGDFETKFVKVQKDFLQHLADLPANLSPATKKAIKTLLEEEAKAIGEANTGATGGAAGADTAPSGPSGPPAPPTDKGGDQDIYSFFKNRVGDSRIIGLGAGHKNPSWHAVLDACLKNVAWAKRYLGDQVHHSGYPTAASVGHALDKEGKMHAGYAAPRGALYWWNGGIGRGRGHVAVADGMYGAINNLGGNRIEKYKASGVSNRAYMGWTSYKALAEGGIVKKPTHTLTGEAGPEAVVPLNRGGAKVLAETMVRYVENTKAKGLHASQHTSQITNNLYTYDQRTQFNGEVHVQSQDPEEMARKLAAKQRLARVARKQGVKA